MANIDRIILNAIGDIYGFQVTWKYRARDYNQVEVIEAHKRNGLEYNHLQKGQQRIKIVERALQKAKSKNLLREIENTTEQTRYQFTEEFLAENAQGEKYIDFKVSDFIVYDKVLDRVLCDNPEKQELIKRLMQHCSETFTVTDLTRYFKKLFQETRMVSICNSGGGVYFIPAEHVDLVEKAQRCFREIDPKGIFHITEIPKLKHSRETMIQNVEITKLEKLEKVREKILELQKNETSMSQTIFKNTMNELLVDMKDLEFYQDLLEIQFNKAKKTVTDIERMTTEYFMGKDISSVKEEDKEELTPEKMAELEADLGI